MTTETTNIAQIEGLLFISGDEGITVGDLAKITGFMKPAITAMLDKLAAHYAGDPDCALVVLHSGQTYRLATKPSLAPVIKQYFEIPLTVPLTNALLEVLAIVAYRQPITRLEIDEVRGVQSSGSLQKLMARGLVDTHGRLDAPGRPFRYVTTESFLDYFGLSSLDDLPPLPEGADVDTADLSGDLFLSAFQSRKQGGKE
ncbi:SMC-Scp complex subunit ScpB [Limosilactobacillus pontis]|uniref:Segregation and condensation protein B n=1 Tax=Limosilactobacillus pontis TaxID=35787 RepID=A0ABU7SQU3_9LACO|nr:SMC-Scp complex subunit ScpB [Limosilactobacillus pontis]MCX2185997.1 SMC-Scp complex subunit ScpB [Limosilactobacillus pontis]MCX2187738.1 SMC-Scp complex subunit ScpB [Limosilactobacillus pontis]